MTQDTMGHTFPEKGPLLLLSSRARPDRLSTTFKSIFEKEQDSRAQQRILSLIPNLDSQLFGT